jgi:2-oxoglutarate ferredoxin oxidoreductase subunit beta
MVQLADYESEFENKWCPGCGNFGILQAMKTAMVNMNIAPRDLLLVSGIGQSGKTPHFLQCNGFHGLHGRALPLATGAKLANDRLTILVNSGDGDCYGEGGNHFLHAIRRNVDITLLVHNNMIYGLTKGQASPTSSLGMVTKLQSQGVIAEPMNPLTLALSMGAGFVARSFSGEIQSLSRLIQQAIEYPGFSLIDILQTCPSFNKLNTFDWYKERVFDLSKTDHDPENFDQAFSFARQWGDQIPIGLFYCNRKKTYSERLGTKGEGALITEAYDPEKLETLIRAQ